MEQDNSKSVCIVWQGFYPWDVRLEKFIACFTKFYRVCLVSKGKDDNPLSEEHENLSIYRVRAGLFLKKIGAKKIAGIINAPIFFNPFWMIRCFSVARNNKASLILVRDLPMMWLGLIVGRILRIPVIFDMAENYPAALIAYNKKCYKPFLIGNAFFPRWYERLAASLSAKVFVVTEEQKERLIKKNVSGDKIVVVGNTPALSEEFFNNNNNADRADKTVLYTGKIDIHRGVDVAIKALPQLMKKHPGLVLVLAGAGTEVDKLRLLARKLGVERNVRFLGWISHQEIYDNILKSTVCLIPHVKSEHTDTTLPNKLFDYMALGKPVISSDLIPVVRILKEYGCGLIFKSGDPESLAQQIEKALDSELLKKLGVNGQKAVKERFRWDIDEKILASVTSDLIERKTNG